MGDTHYSNWAFESMWDLATKSFNCFSLNLNWAFSHFVILLDNLWSLTLICLWLFLFAVWSWLCSMSTSLPLAETIFRQRPSDMIQDSLLLIPYCVSKITNLVPALFLFSWWIECRFVCCIFLKNREPGFNIESLLHFENSSLLN